MANIFSPLAGERHGWTDFRRAARAVPSPVLQGIMAASLLCGLLPAMAKTLHPDAWFAAPVNVAVPLRAIDVSDASDAPRSRCPGCGIVESIRALAPVEGSPASYEFIVRLRDGTLRTSTTDGKAAWRVGDPILLVGGPARL